MKERLGTWACARCKDALMGIPKGFEFSWWSKNIIMITKHCRSTRPVASLKIRCALLLVERRAMNDGNIDHERNVTCDEK